jgi:uncharacterized protein YfdQ (DUF2303 family)
MTELSTITGDTQAIIDTAIAAATPQGLDDEERFFSVVTPAGGDVTVIDLEEKRTALLAAPRRKKGEYRVHDADSFVTYLFKHGDTDAEVWADTVSSQIVGVLNAHMNVADGARWEDHRVLYRVLLTDAWKAWAERDGKLLDQATFAEHIEDRAIDIVEPAAAEMLELAQTFQATIGVNFESSKRLSSGERQLEYRETVDAKAGKAGRLDIPETFTLGLRPFEGADAFKVTARLRYRIVDGTLRIGYKLERPADVLREAFLGVVSAIQTQLAESDNPIPILRGSRS